MTTDYSGPPLRPEPKPEKKIERVTTSEAIQKQKPLGRKFKDVFLGGDIKLAVRYVTGDVLLPALRNMIVDVTSKGIERMVFGESMRRSPIDYRPRTQYSSYSRTAPFAPDPRRRVFMPDQNPYRVHRRESQDILLATREDADRVVERLLDIVDKYEMASLADLYELVGLPSSHIDNKWGWTFLNNVEVRQVREGFLIDLPPLEAL